MKYHPNSFVSDSYRIQTYNLLIRSQMLYSVELRSQVQNGIACLSKRKWSRKPDSNRRPFHYE